MAPAESPFYRLLRRQSLAFLVAAIMASTLLIFFGISLENGNPIISKLLIIIGSSGLGTCLGLTVGSITGASAVHRIKELIEHTLTTSLYAGDEYLAPFRKSWHHYLLTQMGGKRVWRYRTFDFSRIQVPGKLLTTFSVKTPSDAMHFYQIEAFVTPPRLIFVQHATVGTEVPVIHIYPYSTDAFREVLYGSAYLQTWDGDPICTRVIMASSSIELSQNPYSEGNLAEPDSRVLDSLWEKHAQKVGLIAPPG